MRKTARPPSPTSTPTEPTAAPTNPSRNAVFAFSSANSFPSAAPPPVVNDYSASRAHKKCRRLERATFDSIRQEVHLYLDSIHEGNSQWGDQSLRKTRSDRALVDNAVAEAFRVLRSCWMYTGNPGDAFEPVESISHIALDLLINYGHHKLTADGRYAVLRGGEEELPWVGCLLMVLWQYLYRQRKGKRKGPRGQRRLPSPLPSAPFARDGGRVSPFRSWNVPCDHASSQSSLSQEDFSSPASPVAPPISRVLLLNCHSFGWLDSIGNEDYERSARCLHQINAALGQMIYDKNYTHLGRPSSTQLPSGESASTVVLLSNAILMDGGVPSLTVTERSEVVTVHHQYGRGLACFVADLPPSDALRPPKGPAVTDSRGYFVPPPPLPPATQNEEADPTIEEAGLSDQENPTTREEVASVELLRLVSCGSRCALGVAAEAVLLHPLGPLVLHVQFEENVTNTFGSMQPPATRTSGGGTVAHATMEAPQASSAKQLPSVLHDLVTGALQPNVPDGLFRLSLLTEFVEWVLHLLRCPVPVLLVEWHLDGPEQPDAVGFGLCARAPSSTILELLWAYQDALTQRMGTNPALVHHDVPRPELLQENVCEVIQDTVRSFTRWEGVSHFDGRERPLVFTKDLLVAPETELRVNEDTVITSLQYKRQ